MFFRLVDVSQFPHDLLQHQFSETDWAEKNMADLVPGLSPDGSDTFLKMFYSRLSPTSRPWTGPLTLEAAPLGKNPTKHPQGI